VPFWSKSTLAIAFRWREARVSLFSLTFAGASFLSRGGRLYKGGEVGAWRLFQTSSSPGSSRSKPWELCNLGGKLLSSPVNAKEPSENPSEPRAKAEVQETSTTSHHVFYFKRVNPLIKAKISFCNVKFSERGMKALSTCCFFHQFRGRFLEHYKE